MFEILRAEVILRSEGPKNLSHHNATGLIIAIVLSKGIHIYKCKAISKFHFITPFLLIISLTSSSWGAPDDAALRDRQWSQIIDLEARGRQDPAYSLFRRVLLDLDLRLVGEWQGAHIQLPAGVTLPIILDAPNESRSAFLARARDILDNDPTQRFIALTQLKQFKQRRLLRGWSSGVRDIMNALYGNDFWSLQRLDWHGEEALILRLSRFDDEEAFEALRRIAIYDPKHRAYALDRLNSRGTWSVEDLEMINYSFFAGENERDFLAAILAAGQIQHADTVTLLVDNLHCWKDRANLAGEPLNIVIQAGVAQALGSVGIHNRPLAVNALVEMNREAGLAHLSTLQETCTISLGLLGAFDRFPQSRGDFCLGNSLMSERWERVARALNMSLDEIIASAVFAHRPPIAIAGESLNLTTLLRDFDAHLSQHHYWSPDMPAALREVLSRQLTPSATEQAMLLHAAPVIDSLRVLQREGRLSLRFLALPLSRFLLPR